MTIATHNPWDDPQAYWDTDPETYCQHLERATYQELLDAITPTFTVECRSGMYIVQHRRTGHPVYRTEDWGMARDYAEAMNLGGPF